MGNLLIKEGLKLKTRLREDFRRRTTEFPYEGNTEEQNNGYVVFK